MRRNGSLVAGRRRPDRPPRRAPTLSLETRPPGSYTRLEEAVQLG